MRGKILWPVLLLCVAISGCGTTKFLAKPVEYQRQELVVRSPDATAQRPLRFIVITKKNLDEKIREMEANGEQFVLVGLTTDGYENLALNEADLRRFIQQQDAVIAAYKEYYDTTPSVEEMKPDTPFWKFW